MDSSLLEFSFQFLGKREDWRLEIGDQGLLMEEDQGGAMHDRPDHAMSMG
jgi:hypothetical protein